MDIVYYWETWSIWYAIMYIATGYLVAMTYDCRCLKYPYNKILLIVGATWLITALMLEIILTEMSEETFGRQVGWLAVTLIEMAIGAVLYRVTRPYVFDAGFDVDETSKKR